MMTLSSCLPFRSTRHFLTWVERLRWPQSTRPKSSCQATQDCRSRGARSQRSVFPGKNIWFSDPSGSFVNCSLPRMSTRKVSSVSAQKHSPVSLSGLLNCGKLQPTCCYKGSCEFGGAFCFIRVGTFEFDRPTLT